MPLATCGASGFGKHAPALHAAAVASLTRDQLEEAEVIAAVRAQVADELGDRRPEDRQRIEQQAAQVGLSFMYDGLYRYESNAAMHATLLAVDLLLEKVPRGLVLRSEPTSQFVPLPVYLHGAELLYVALDNSGEHSPTLRIAELPSLGDTLRGLVEQHASSRLPNWQDLLSSEAFNQSKDRATNAPRRTGSPQSRPPKTPEGSLDGGVDPARRSRQVEALSMIG